jgi:dimethylargininase
LIAFTRAVSPRIVECELSFLDRQPIDFPRAAAQHEAYERALESLGCEIVHIDPAPEHPDGVFVEDAAVILDRYAIITRPGADSRRGETVSVARALESYMELRPIESGTLDGGDVLVVDRIIYVGRSARTNSEGIDQLQNLAPDYHVLPVDFRDCLHLKSAVTSLGPGVLLANPQWVDVAQFAGCEIVPVAEPHAANALAIGDSILLGAAYPATRRAIESLGYEVVPIEIGELAKAEAGVTCCSLIYGYS